MKKVLFICVTVLIGVICCACSKEEISLSVYVVSDEALYMNALEDYQEEFPTISLEITTFENYEDMNTRLNAELMAGKGPDILLYNSLYSKNDSMKLALGGVFQSLDGYMKEEDMQPCADALLKSGQYEGKQYILPFSWNVMIAQSTKSYVEGQNYDKMDLYSVLLTEAERLKENTERDVCCKDGLLRPLGMNSVLDIAGVDLIRDGKVVANKDEVSQAGKFAKMFYDTHEKNTVLMNKYGKGLADISEHFSYILNDYPFLLELLGGYSNFSNMLGEEMYAEPIGQMNGTGLSAQIIQYGAINANATKTEAQIAWGLLKYIYDYPYAIRSTGVGVATWWYAPVKWGSYEDCLAQLTVQLNGLAPFSEEQIDMLKQTGRRITKGVIANAFLDELVQEVMLPYLEGKVEFDSCYKQLEEQLKLYLNE